MNDAKYIGYLALEIANTMWPSGLCRVGDEFCLSSLLLAGVRTDRTGLTARHSLAMLQGLQKGQESIIRFEMARLAAIW
jgi:hypothetical protein